VREVTSHGEHKRGLCSISAVDQHTVPAPMLPSRPQ
jgi:hypothetical protein